MKVYELNPDGVLFATYELAENSLNKIANYVIKEYGYKVIDIPDGKLFMTDNGFRKEYTIGIRDVRNA